MAKRSSVLLLALLWSSMVVGLVGPSLNKQEETVYRSMRSHVIVLDLSQSMNAEDVSPSRLARAKFKVLDLLGQGSADRMALVVFSGEPYVVSPLTSDTKTISQLTNVLETNLMPSHGENMAGGLTKAMELLVGEGMPGGDVILVTGSKPGASAMRAAATLKSRGYTLDVLAVGTEKGAPMPTVGGFVKDEKGNIKVSKLPTTDLRALARQGGGRFVRFTADSSDINQFAALFNKQGEAEAVSETVSQWVDEGYWFALVGACLMLPFFRKGKVRLF